MYGLFIFSIICLGGMHSVSSRLNSSQPKFWTKTISECVREMNLDENKYLNIDEIQNNHDDESKCFMACSIRKYFGEVFSIPAPNIPDKLFMYNGTIQMIDEAYNAVIANKTAELHEISGADYTRKGVVKKIDDCNHNNENECDFFKCLELDKSPLVEYYFTHVIMIETQYAAKHKFNNLITKK